jgi:xanthine dehydrogenase accessory factor
MPRLHVFGAGHVGAAVAGLAVQLGIETLVYDDRQELLTEERLPGTRPTHLIPSDPWEHPPYELGDYVVLASRSHRYDHQLLTKILQDAPNYIGVLASSRKWTLMHAALLTEGFPADLLDRVNAPVGLPINSQTVPEIAVSILAQIVSHYRGGRLV